MSASMAMNPTGRYVAIAASFDCGGVTRTLEAPFVLSAEQDSSPVTLALVFATRPHRFHDAASSRSGQPYGHCRDTHSFVVQRNQVELALEGWTFIRDHFSRVNVDRSKAAR